MDPKKVINKIIGKKKGKDSDMDGVEDKDDCQKHNTMRQDVATRGMGNFQRNMKRFHSRRGPLKK